MYEIDKVKFGAFISKLRKEKGMTQKELAGKLYISDKAVSKWETGHSVPDITLLVPLGEVLGVTVTELLECQRMEKADALDVAQTDDLVKKVIGLSKEQSCRPHLKKKQVLCYFGCICVAAAEAVLLCLLQEKLQMGVFPELFPLFMMMGMTLLFGIYFWFFMKETLPSYYDEQNISVYVDGIMHLNIPGVSFHNHNWKYIVKAFRMYSSVGLVLMPLVYVPLSIALSAWRPLSDIVLLLSLVLGGMFLPSYILGRKYQNPKREAQETGKRTKKRLLGIFMIGVLFFGIFFWSLGGTFRSAVRMGAIERADRYSWYSKHFYLDGFLQRAMWNTAEDGRLNIAVLTEEGSISVQIEDALGKILFEEENMETGTYQGLVTGNYVVRVTAKKHKGSFKIGE